MLAALVSTGVRLTWQALARQVEVPLLSLLEGDTPCKQRGGASGATGGRLHELQSYPLDLKYCVTSVPIVTLIDSLQTHIRLTDKPQEAVTGVLIAKL